MRKLAFSLVLLLACAFGAQADVLYWMIDTTSFEDPTFSDWSYATLTANPKSGGAAIQLGWAEDSEVYQYKREDISFGAASYFDIANPGNYTYLIELWNESEAKVAQAVNPYSYATIQSMLQSQGMNPGMVIPLTGDDFGAVPEPTSGLLFLMGGVLLGLRRRRMA